MPAPFYVSYIVLWALVVFLGLVVVGLVHALRDAQPATAAEAGSAPADPHDALVGAPMPEFRVSDVHGGILTPAGLRGTATAMLFVSPDCSTCAVTLHELDALKRRMGGKVIVVCRSTEERCVSLAHHYDLSVPVVADDDRRLSDLFRVTVPPMAVLIAADGTIESYGRPMGASDLEQQFHVHEAGDHDAGQAAPVLAIHKVGESS